MDFILRVQILSSVLLSHVIFFQHKAVFIYFKSVENALQFFLSVKAQSDLTSWQIHSINLDPSCPYQLAFHLDNGWQVI